jgi:hypothetical protein
MQQSSWVYANYKDLELIYDTASHTFEARWTPMGVILESARLVGADSCGEHVFGMDDFAQTKCRTLKHAGPGGNGILLEVRYTGRAKIKGDFALQFLLTADRLCVRCECSEEYSFCFEGWARWGAAPDTDTFAMCLNRSGTDLRAALGPAASASDDALFDRQTDTALAFTGCPTPGFRYDWDRKAYRFALHTDREFTVRIHRDLYANRFGIRYSPYNKNCTFPTPPAGWMTWYAVKFDACEEKVLENARWMAENLKPYGANTIWVDWEWYHRDFTGRHAPGVDVFNPDPTRYPRGMAPVAAAIRELGLIPALWIGATNDVNETDFMRENPDAVLCFRPSWCGSWFLDPTHPKVLNEYIPKAFAQLIDWGYEALKWDCMPITIQYCDENHNRFHDPSVSTEDAIRAMVQKARDTVGENYYMLSCSGDDFRQITMAMDIFDAMRIGGDIFKWDEFVSQCVARVMKYYTFHNIICLNDPDTLVLRPKYNRHDEAVSRVSLVGILGLPVNYGDDLPSLPADRVELLRRVTPALDIRPMDVRENTFDSHIVKASLAICRPYEQWSVAHVMNLDEKTAQVTLSLADDVHLETGDGIEYLIFDFWQKKYLGSSAQTVTLEVPGHGSRVLSVRRRIDRPQIVSTSRHITQGAAEIRSMGWDEEGLTLWGRSQTVAGESYEMFVRVPEGYQFDRSRSDCVLFEHLSQDVFRVVFPVRGGGESDWRLGYSTTP